MSINLNLDFEKLEKKICNDFKEKHKIKKDELF
jgi:hypothetical protein